MKALPVSAGCCLGWHSTWASVVYVFHVPWERLLAEFDVHRSGLLGIGIHILFLAP